MIRNHGDVLIQRPVGRFLEAAFARRLIDRESLFGNISSANLFWTWPLSDEQNTSCKTIFE